MAIDLRPPGDDAGIGAESVALVVVTSEGRGGTLDETWARLNASLNRASTFSYTLVTSDGLNSAIVNADAVRLADHLLARPRRQGYWANIEQATRHLGSIGGLSTVFWLEDDWALEGSLNVQGWVSVLMANPTLCQIRIPKTPYLLLEDRNRGSIGNSIFATDASFSLNPSIIRLSMFRVLIEDARNECEPNVNVEVGLSRAMRARGWLAGVVDPEVARAVHLEGGKEDVNRYEWHMISGGGAAEGDKTAEAERKLKHGSCEGPVSSKTPELRWTAIVKRAGELLGKAGFAIGATLAAAASLPVSRQSRAFIRHVYRYWRPLFSSPEALDVPIRPAEKRE